MQIFSKIILPIAMEMLKLKNCNCRDQRIFTKLCPPLVWNTGKMWVLWSKYPYYAIWNWGRGTWTKIKIYGPPAARGGRVQFDFWKGPAGWPSTVLFFKLSCWAAESSWQAGQARSIRRPDEAAVGHPAGPFQKSNCTRPPRGRTVYFDFWPSPPPLVPYGLCTPMSH